MRSLGLSWFPQGVDHQFISGPTFNDLEISRKENRKKEVGQDVSQILNGPPDWQVFEPASVNLHDRNELMVFTSVGNVWNRLILWACINCHWQFLYPLTICSGWT